MTRGACIVPLVGFIHHYGRLDMGAYGDPVRVWQEEGFRLTLWDTGTTRDGKCRLAYVFEDSLSVVHVGESATRVIFSGEDFYCSPLNAIDSDACVASLLGFLALRPGDTDSEYFDAYTPAQLGWTAQRAEYLALLAYELEEACGRV